MAWTVKEASTWLGVSNNHNSVKTSEFTTRFCVKRLKSCSGSHKTVSFMDHQWKVNVKCWQVHGINFEKPASLNELWYQCSKYVHWRLVHYVNDSMQLYSATCGTEMGKSKKEELHVQYSNIQYFHAKTTKQAQKVSSNKIPNRLLTKLCTKTGSSVL